MADPAYQPTLVWGNDSLVWASRTLAWDQYIPPPDTLGDTIMVQADRAVTLMAQGDRARTLMAKDDRGRHLMVKRGHRRP